MAEARPLRWLIWLVIVAALPTPAAAHVRWFVPEWMRPQPPGLGLIFGWPTPAVVTASLGLFVSLRLVERLVGTPHWPDPSSLAYMEPSATALLAVHTGISLVWFAYQGNLFVPQLGLPPNLLGWMLVALQTFVGFTFIKGLFDRAGALLLILVFFRGVLVSRRSRCWTSFTRLGSRWPSLCWVAPYRPSGSPGGWPGFLAMRPGP